MHLNEVCFLFSQVAHWHGHRLPVTSVDVMKSPHFLISTSKDTKVCLWTWTGGLVGVFGQHEWDISDRSTWQDPEEQNKQPPLRETELLFLQVGRTFLSESTE